MTDPSRPTATDDRAELAGLLPPPGDPHLPAGLREHLRDHVLSEIRSAPAVRPRRRLILAVPAAATVLTAVLATGLVLRSGAEPADRPAGRSAAVQVLPGDQKGTAAFLNRAALVAAARPDTSISPGQYVYVRSRVAWTSQVGDGPRTLDELHDREIWIPQSAGDEGLIRERGETIDLVGAVPNGWSVDLPTDPDELLRAVHRRAHRYGDDRDAGSFAFIGDLLRESLMSPELSAALYRVAAKIPGVQLVPDAVDATGRHGVAVARVNAGERTEWIFDPDTFEYLGERSYLVEDTDGGKAGMLTATTAVLGRAVVDRMGETP
ncbi:CU044_5270 family protein [Jidongwangia harbinensis]|uniref:CU044_5270 family protein n=1 Tax=Jidongwangia harbinensis TaxID=2878561 RepID=UPI001CD98989|nr:CU044_5270 family protein [Jidongwangia harbinensis]MCA2217331.1 CU044_5270 family protein [Jidongwangia harbinensis]